MTDTALQKTAHDTSFAVLLAIGLCHLLNDMVQALLPAIYPTLKVQFHLNFAQIGLVTLAFQVTASLLQPLVGYFADLKPMPYSLALGMVATLIGLLVLSVAPNYAVLLVAAMMVGLGSAVFHPEASRVARMASGGRYGLAQSVFQVGTMLYYPLVTSGAFHSRFMRSAILLLPARQQHLLVKMYRCAI